LFYSLLMEPATRRFPVHRNEVHRLVAQGRALRFKMAGRLVENAGGM
jgi:hypothetical protein